MCLSDVVNQLHDKYSLAYTGTTEETNLTTLLIRSQQIDDLNTSDKHIGSRTLLGEGWGISVDGHEFVGLNRSIIINRLTNNIDDSTKSTTTNGDGNGLSSVNDILASNKTFGGIQSNSSDVVTTKMLGDLEDESRLNTLNLKGVKNRRKVSFELYIDDGTNNLRNLASSSGEGSYIMLE